MQFVISHVFTYIDISAKSSKMTAVWTFSVLFH